MHITTHISQSSKTYQFSEPAVTHEFENFPNTSDEQKQQEDQQDREPGQPLPTCSHYETLNIPGDAKPEVIRKAYRRKALKCHPDRYPDKEHEFKLLQKAYDTLSDPDKRFEYDQTIFSYDESLAVYLRDSEQYGLVIPSQHAAGTSDLVNFTYFLLKKFKPQDGKFYEFLSKHANKKFVHEILAGKLCNIYLDSDELMSLALSNEQCALAIVNNPKMLIKLQDRDHRFDELNTKFYQEKFFGVSGVDKIGYPEPNYRKLFKLYKPFIKDGRVIFCGEGAKEAVKKCLQESYTADNKRLLALGIRYEKVAEALLLLLNDQLPAESIFELCLQHHSIAKWVLKERAEARRALSGFHWLYLVCYFNEFNDKLGQLVGRYADTQERLLEAATLLESEYYAYRIEVVYHGDCSISEIYTYEDFRREWIRDAQNPSATKTRFEMPEARIQAAIKTIRYDECLFAIATHCWHKHFENLRFSNRIMHNIFKNIDVKEGRNISFDWLFLYLQIFYFSGHHDMVECFLQNSALQETLKDSEVFSLAYKIPMIRDRLFSYPVLSGKLSVDKKIELAFREYNAYVICPEKQDIPLKFWKTNDFALGYIHTSDYIKQLLAQHDVLENIAGYHLAEMVNRYGEAIKKIITDNAVLQERYQDYQDRKNDESFDDFLEEGYGKFASNCLTGHKDVWDNAQDSIEVAKAWVDILIKNPALIKVEKLKALLETHSSIFYALHSSGQIDDESLDFTNGKVLLAYLDSKFLYNMFLNDVEASEHFSNCSEILYRTKGELSISQFKVLAMKNFKWAQAFVDSGKFLSCDELTQCQVLKKWNSLQRISLYLLNSLAGLLNNKKLCEINFEVSEKDKVEQLHVNDLAQIIHAYTSVLAQLHISAIKRLLLFDLDMAIKVLTNQLDFSKELSNEFIFLVAAVYGKSLINVLEKENNVRFRLEWALLNQRLSTMDEVELIKNKKIEATFGIHSSITIMMLAEFCQNASLGQDKAEDGSSALLAKLQSAMFLHNHLEKAENWLLNPESILFILSQKFVNIIETALNDDRLLSGRSNNQENSGDDSIALLEKREQQVLYSMLVSLLDSNTKTIYHRGLARKVVSFLIAHIREADSPNFYQIVRSAKSRFEVEKFNFQPFLSLTNEVIVARCQAMDQNTLNQMLETAESAAEYFFLGKLFANKESTRYDVDQAIKWLFRAYAVDQRFDAAYEQALTLSQDGRLYYRRAMLMLNNNEDDRALEDFNRQIAQDPRDYQSLFVRAKIYNKKGKYLLAIDDVMNALIVHPDIPEKDIFRSKIINLMGVNLLYVIKSGNELYARRLHKIGINFAQLTAEGPLLHVVVRCEKSALLKWLLTLPEIQKIIEAKYQDQTALEMLLKSVKGSFSDQQTRMIIALRAAGASTRGHALPINMDPGEVEAGRYRTIQARLNQQEEKQVDAEDLKDQVETTQAATQFALQQTQRIEEQQRNMAQQMETKFNQVLGMLMDAQKLNNLLIGAIVHDGSPALIENLRQHASPGLLQLPAAQGENNNANNANQLGGALQGNSIFTATSNNAIDPAEEKKNPEFDRASPG